MRSLLVQMDRAEEGHYLKVLPLPVSKVPAKVVQRLCFKKLAYAEEGILYPIKREEK